MGLLEIVFIGLILVILGIVGVRILWRVGQVVLSVVFHMLLGWVLLFIWNILPFFKIPITILTVLVAGLGGVLGVGILVLAKALGLY
ncbi:MAG: pro-sigmaK processing inhibitor BofA family protein [Euryarchaeota archaeon]|jgi:inhibitor of the pro-sigma K processing machinery|nr:pro-sigmaK processing inhibitor BofA family protein [Euryarchaeota archaeon]HNS25063.1 pro-sigmaK processing inhibitor BofA family protein [Methanobacteriaceae archaeon]